MREILRASTLSLAHSVKLALEAAGIEAEITGQDLTGILGNPFSVCIVNDADVPKAREVVRRFEGASNDPEPRHRPD